MTYFTYQLIYEAESFLCETNRRAQGASDITHECANECTASSSESSTHIHTHTHNHNHSRICKEPDPQRHAVICTHSQRAIHALQDKALAYFSNMHMEHLRHLYEVLSEDSWQRLPVPMSYKLVSLRNIGRMNFKAAHYRYAHINTQKKNSSKIINPLESPIATRLLNTSTDVTPKSAPRTPKRSVKMSSPHIQNITPSQPNVYVTNVFHNWKPECEWPAYEHSPKTERVDNSDDDSGQKDTPTHKSLEQNSLDDNALCRSNTGR